MHKSMGVMVFTLFTIFAGGCAMKSDYVLPEEARKLTEKEITSAFSNARDKFIALDDPGLTATVTYISDGDFSAKWKKGWFFRGSVNGNWYTDGDQLCVKTTTKVDGSDLWCVSIYEFDGNYTAVYSDGSYQGISTLTPMGEVMSSEQLREKWIGNTICGGYAEDGEMIEVWEYHHEDGTLYGRDAKYGDYRAIWDIRDSGCFHSDYENDKYDGCYYHVHDSGDRYWYHRPWSDEVGKGVFFEGNPQGLGE